MQKDADVKVTFNGEAQSKFRPALDLLFSVYGRVHTYANLTVEGTVGNKKVDMGLGRFGDFTRRAIWWRENREGDMEGQDFLVIEENVYPAGVLAVALWQDWFDNRYRINLELLNQIIEREYMLTHNVVGMTGTLYQDLESIYLRSKIEAVVRGMKVMDFDPTRLANR